MVRESGDAAALHGQAADVAAYFGQMGLRLSGSQTWGSGVLRPYASLALEHGFGDHGGTFDLAFAGGTNSAYRVTGTRLATDRAVIRLGADMTRGRLSLGLGFVGQYGRGESSTSGQARLAWRF